MGKQKAHTKYREASDGNSFFQAGIFDDTLSNSPGNSCHLIYYWGLSELRLIVHCQHNEFVV